MATNGWGAPRIHGELKKLGFKVSEATVSRYMPLKPADPDQLKRWVTFLRNHKDVIAAMDLFTVPTASLRVLYGFASSVEFMGQFRLRQLSKRMI
jgi:hypothetical protein